MKSERYQLIIILLIVFMGFLGSSMPYPIFPPLFLHPAHGAIVPDGWSESHRSIFLGIALAAYPLGQFFGAPLLGGCSDRYGRKIILLLSLVGSTLGYFLSALSLEFNLLWLLIISRFFTGLLESNLPIVRAMAADLQNTNKYRSFGRINSIGALGYITGPIIGGFLSDGHLVPWFSFAVPFYLAAGLCALSVLLVVKQFKEDRQSLVKESISFWQRLNIFKRMNILFHNKQLKNLLLVSSVFTLSVDIFYEFGPVYLTGIWLMTPAMIALYNAILSLALCIGGGWLPHRLSEILPVERIVRASIIITAFVLALMVFIPNKIVVFILFGICGLSIAVMNTTITIQLSNSAHSTEQGETMGAQLGLRMLGDAIICLVGGLVITLSFVAPIIVSSIIALAAAFIYTAKFSYKKNTKI